ncbi:MAG: InlB B-repeat-containing protein [Myxococcales bacterium]
MNDSVRWSVGALCVAVLAACGPDGAAGGPGTASEAPTVETLKIDVTGNGSVSSDPRGIDCGTICSATFADGTPVTLTAKSASGWSFTGWSGACSGTTACVVVMKSNANVTATFVAAAEPPPAPGPNPAPAPDPNPPPAPAPNPAPAPAPNPSPPPPAPAPNPPPPSPAPVPNPPPPTADECADLVPATLPPPVVAEISSNNSLPCTRGVADDLDGTFLLGYFAGIGPVFPAWDFFQVQDGKAVALNKSSFGSDEGGKLFFSQPSGFTSFTISGQTQGSDLTTWSHDGHVVSNVQIAVGDFSHPPSSAVGIDPSGGTATAKTVLTNDSGWVTRYQRFDKHGVAETGEVQIDTGEHRVGGVGVAFSGDALVLSSVGNPNWQARWVARDGSPISGPFNLQGSGFPAFQFLADGSLALGFVNRFTDAPTNFAYRIEDGASVADPLPDWLAPRAANQLYVVRSGKAYATWGAGGRCGGDLEILAASSGKSCGCVKVPKLTASASVGRDGSLMVPSSAGPRCSYDLYPKLLR